MARRGFALLFTVLGAAVFLSMAGFALLYLLFGREPTVSSNSTRVRAVMLRPTGFDSPFWGKVQEVRDAVIEFKKSGKPVYAYLEYGGDREYYLATAADKVFLLPS